MTWEIVPRDADLGRTLDPLSRWTSLDLVERYNAPDTWVIEGAAAELSTITPGMGCILARDGQVVTSGKVRSIDRTAGYSEDDSGRPVLQDTITLGFIADSRRLWERLCYPDPTHLITDEQSVFSVSHDTRTGPHEDLILGYIADNLGPAAPIASRRLADLVLPTSLERGEIITKKARMNVLGDLVAELAEQAGLRVRIVHDEQTGTPRLLLVIDDVPDVSENIIFGPPDVGRATGHVTSWGYKIEAPTATDPIAFSAGEMTEREATRLSDADAIELWGDRVEMLVDQRQTDESSEITAALRDRLIEGATPVSVEFSVAPGGDTVYRTDYDVGSRVGVELPGLPDEVSDNVIREAHTQIQHGQRETFSLVVGTPGAQSASTARAARLNRALQRIALIERSR